MKPALSAAILPPAGREGTAGLGFGAGGGLIPRNSSSTLPLPAEATEVTEVAFDSGIDSEESRPMGLVGRGGISGFGLSGRVGAFRASVGDGCLTSTGDVSNGALEAVIGTSEDAGWSFCSRFGGRAGREGGTCSLGSTGSATDLLP